MAEQTRSSLSSVKTSLELHKEKSEDGHKKSKLLGNIDELDPHRQGLVELLERRAVEMFIGGCILFNMFLLILETDASVYDSNVAGWVTIMNYVLLCFYIIELLLRLIAYQCQFFHSGWNVLDLAIVCSDLTLLALDLVIGNMPKITVLRAFRLVRLARAFKALSMLPELALLLNGFVSAIKAIFWGMSLILVVITIWAILSVQLIHPINKEVTESGLYERSGCERCPHAFESVFKASLTIFQTLVAGDSWGAVALPIIETSPLAGLFFLLVLVTVSLAIMNLILAVIVERAQEVKEESNARAAEEKHSEFKQAVATLEKMFVTLDKDNSGHLTKEELLGGFEFRDFAETMEIIGLRAEDTDTLFDALDEDNSGDIHFPEFVSQLFRLKNPDLHFVSMDLMILKQRLAKIKQIMANDLSSSSSLSSQEVIADSTGISASTAQDKASSELVASVRNLVSHSLLQSSMLTRIDSALNALPSGQTSPKSALGSVRPPTLACMPGKSQPLDGWQSLNPLNILGQPNELVKPQPSIQVCTEAEKSGTPLHVEQVSLIQSPPETSRSAGVTTPRSSLEVGRRLPNIPLNSTGHDSPVQTPRECILRTP